jgi:23S rRNA (guanine2445-N2)-methyltransferase / 23S rRNA (guanine2069-N7)-methyltransferase
VQRDALEFLRRDHGHYGLIFVDPPTFSNSKRAGDFSVQRDHAELLLACAERLDDGGVVVFSNNFRRFKFDAGALEACYSIEDWTAPSIPVDFSRRAAIHRCWLLRKHAPEPGTSPWDGARPKR